MTTPRNRADDRTRHVMRAGFHNAHIRVDGTTITIGCRAPCGASLRIPLAGELPRCGETCPCGAASKAIARAKA